MIKKQLWGFIIRWGLSAIGLWWCFRWFGEVSAATVEGEFWRFIVENEWARAAFAGLVFAGLNVVVKPLVKVITLPLMVLSLGLFSVVLNAALVWLVVWLVPGVEMEPMGLVWTMVVMSVINGVVNFLV